MPNTGTAMSPGSRLAAKHVLRGRARLRDFWLRVHRYLAFSAGLVLALLALTGALLAFNDTFVQWEYQSLATLPSGSHAPIESWRRQIAASHPDLAEIAPGLVVLPGESWRMLDLDAAVFIYELQALKPAAPDYHVFVAVDPLTGTPLERFVYEQSWAGLPFRLHTTLMLPFGGELTAITAILLSVSIGSGLWLWWPGWRRIGASLKIRWKGRMAVLARDLHTLISLAVLPFVVLVAASGLYLSKQNWVVPLLPAAVTVSSEVALPSRPASCQAPLSIDDALATAYVSFPDRRITSLYPLDAEWRRLGFQMVSRDATYLQPPAWRLEIDRQCEEPIHLERPAAVEWLLPLHSAEIIGPLRRFVTPLIGFLLVALSLAGFALWFARQRLRTRR